MDLSEEIGATSIAVTNLEQAVDGFYRVVFRDLNTVKKQSDRPAK